MSSKKAKAQERAERAAALLAAQKKRERQRRILSIGAVVVAVVVIVGGAVWYSQSQGEVNAPETTEYGLAIGPSDAPHSVVVYEDFLCPVCGAFEAAGGDDLARLADDGEVRVEYRPISIFPDYSWSPDTLNAFFVVRDESGADVAKEFHDLLYENQPSETGPYPSTDELVQLAVDAGADESAVRPGIEGNTKTEESDGANAEADDAGVQGTPTILLDGEVFQDGGSMEEIAQNLVAAIEE
jgi:protein-disulfide isomerase